MSRLSRKQLITEDEDQERYDREEGYRRLKIEMRRAWREACRIGFYPRDFQLTNAVDEATLAELGYLLST